MLPEHELTIYVQLLKKFRRFYCFRDKLHLAATGNTSSSNFADVWHEALPEPFKSDSILCRRIGDLAKFNVLTYRVVFIDTVLEDKHFVRAEYRNRPEAKKWEVYIDKFMRSVQKAVINKHGV